MINQKKKILAVIVNYGEEQKDYLKKMVLSLKGFEKYETTVIVHSNVPVEIDGIDSVKLYNLENNTLLPSTCRGTIWENRNFYDLFFYSENDVLIKESHFDNFLNYNKILPKNKIAGLIRYEEALGKKYYPDYHADFDWDYNSVKSYNGKLFAYFTNLHQASFILTKDQLNKIGRKFNFNSLVEDRVPLLFRLKRKLFFLLGFKIKKYYRYDVICKVGTDIYKYGGMKKVICISEFEENLIHHMSDVYINGSKGRMTLRSEEERMIQALERMKIGKN